MDVPNGLTYHLLASRRASARTNPSEQVMIRKPLARHSTVGPLLAVALLAWPGHEAAPQSRSDARWEEPSAPPADPAVALNNVARAAYRQAREEAFARSGPVILVEGDNLVLRYGIYRTEVRFTPETYHSLKSISHVPLGIYALLAFAGEAPLDTARVFDLKQYRDAVARMAKTLEPGKLSSAQCERQQRLLKECEAFLDGVIKEQRLERTQWEAFLKEMRPLIDANTEDAARVQLDALHKAVGVWREKLTATEWDRLRVVVMGSQMPRKNNLTVQYFARLLGEEGEGKRIVYAEALFDEAKALDLLGTRLLDTRIGEAFFADPLRMHRDLLGDAAQKYLAKLFEKGP
jgi:hypothetical protein